MKPASTEATSAEALWVESELVRTLMRTAQSTQVAATLAVPIFVGLMWGGAPAVTLALWTVAALLVALGRGLLLRHYMRHLMLAEPRRQLAFFARARPVWTVSALVWGLASALTFDQAPLASQFACWLVLAGLSMIAVNGLSPHLPTARAYINALMSVSLAAVVWRIIELRLDAPYYHYWIGALQLVFWQVMYQSAGRLHLSNRRNFELQFRNSQLINSLTKQTQAALNAVEVKNRFLASATHDIRQPVHALQLYADWLASEPELVHEIAPKIVQSTQAVNTLFDSLFDLVRLDSGSIRLKLEPISLDKLMDELELQYRPLARDKGLDIRFRRRGGEVLSDALLLRRIAGNLVSNAIKYTPKGGVLVAVRGSGSRLRLEVWDTGVGIAPAHQQDVFREFYKVPLHAGTEDGFGLGLHIVSRLSHILGHPVELASKPGRGSVFRLVLRPADPDQAAARAATINQLAL